MSDADVTTRPAKPSDYDDIIALWSAGGLEARTRGRDGRGAFADQLEHFAGTYLVAETNGQVVGVVLGTHDRRKGWINRLTVHPDCQGRGIAQRLIAACERGFVELGIEIFATLIETHNTASVRAFTRAGYRNDVPAHYFRKLLRPDV